MGPAKETMNVLKNPTVDQLRPLIAACDHNEGDHVIWADTQGDVHVTRLARGQDPTSFRRAQNDLVVQLETADQGNGWVGPDAASDDELMGRYLVALVKHWNPRVRNEYVDCF